MYFYPLSPREEALACAEIAPSGLFDSPYYLGANEDVRTSRMDALFHYVRFGEKEGRAPAKGVNLRDDPLFFSPCGNILYQRLLDRKLVSRYGRMVNIFFSVNSKYIPLLSVVIASIAASRSNGNFYRIYVLHNGLPLHEFNKILGMAQENLEIVPVNVAVFVKDIVARAYTSAHITKEAYFRILAPRIFKNLDKIIYLDCDVLVLKDIANLYDMDVDGHVSGAVREKFTDNPYSIRIRDSLPKEVISCYHNSGVQLMNLAQARKDRIVEKCMKLINSGHQYVCHDQDIFNIACLGKIKSLPLEWNFQWQYFAHNSFHYFLPEDFIEYTSCFNNPSLVHFTSLKPWLHDDGHFSQLFWEHARNSPWFAEFKNSCPYDTKYIFDKFERQESKTEEYPVELQ